MFVCPGFCTEYIISTYFNIFYIPFSIKKEAHAADGLPCLHVPFILVLHLSYPPCKKRHPIDEMLSLDNKIPLEFNGFQTCTLREKAFDSLLNRCIGNKRRCLMWFDPRVNNDLITAPVFVMITAVHTIHVV